MIVSWSHRCRCCRRRPPRPFPFSDVGLDKCEHLGGHRSRDHQHQSDASHHSSTMAVHRATSAYSSDRRGRGPAGVDGIAGCIRYAVGSLAHEEYSRVRRVLAHSESGVEPRAHALLVEQAVDRTCIGRHAGVAGYRVHRRIVDASDHSSHGTGSQLLDRLSSPL